MPATPSSHSPAEARVLITGASSGIGLATAQRFHDLGAAVAMLAREGEGLRSAAAQVGGTAVAADVTDRDALTGAVREATASLGGLDVLVVNAGAAAFGPFRETSADAFDRTVETTLIGAVNTIRTALPELERSAGTIVVTSSIAARLPMPLMAAYSAAKHGLRGFLRSLRAELRASGSPVRIAMVAPGPVDTPFWGHAPTTDDRLPPPPPGAYDVEEVAEAIVASAASGKPERTLGVAMIAAQALDKIAGSLVERALALAARLALPPPRREGEGSALWEPSGEGQTSGGLDEQNSALRIDHGAGRGA